MGQHFVPQHYLRQFHVGDAKRIAVARVVPFRWIGSASIKGQCQRGEFYGKDSAVDGAYKEIEAGVAPALREVAACRTWSLQQQFALRMLAVSLHIRTRKAIEAEKVAFRKLADEEIRFAIDRGELPPPPGGWRPGLMDVTGIPSGLLLTTIGCDLEAATLGMKLLAAPRDRSFITSDHPAVAMNPFAYKADPNRRHVGFSKAGFQLLLPLSPEVAVIFYDPKVYKVGRRGERCVTVSPDDVELLNSLQVQSADACLYTHSEAMRPELARLHERYQRLRPNIEDTTRRHELTGPEKAVLFHGQHFSVNAPRPLACVGYRRNIRVRPGDRRDPAHTALVSQLVADLENNPTGGDLDARMRRLFGPDVADD